MTLHGLHVFLNTADFLALFGCCGLLVSRAWTIPSVAFDDMPEVGRAWRRAFAWCIAVLTATGIALLLTRTAEMAGGSAEDLFTDLWVVLTKTHFGYVWALHLLVVLLLLVANTRPGIRPPRNDHPLRAMLGVLALTFTYSATSHASDHGDFTLAEINDWLHVTFAAVWGGSILAARLFAFPLLRNQRPLFCLAAVRLSGLSATVVGLVLLTGLFNAFLELRDFDDVLGTDYGRVLAVKVSLVGIMVLIGAFNRFAIIPHLRAYSVSDEAENAIRRLMRTLIVDAIILVAVLTAAAMLVQGMPPSAMGGMHTMPM